MDNTSRFLAVNLTEAEWQALRAVTPDPCAWIKTQIQQLLDESGVAPEPDEQEPPVRVAWPSRPRTGLQIRCQMIVAARPHHPIESGPSGPAGRWCGDVA